MGGNYLRQRSSFISGAGQLLILIVFIAIITTIAGCSLPSPQSPTWTTQVTVPLANKEYDLPYIIEHANQPELVWDSVSGARFEVSRGLDTIFIEDNIRFEDRAESFSRALGTFTLEPDERLETVFPLSDFIGGVPEVMPPLSTSIEKNFPEFTQIQSATVLEATMLFRIENYFDIAYDSVALRVIDRSSRQLLGTAVFPEGVNAHGETTVAVPVANVTIGNQLALILYARTSGGELNPQDDNQLRVIAEFDGPVEVSAAIAVVPPIVREYLDTVALSHDYQASAATFSDGHISVTVANDLAIGTALELTLPDFTRQGTALSNSGTIDPLGSATVHFDLSNTDYNNSQAGSTPLRVRAVFDSPGSTIPVTISSDDQFSIQAEIVEPVVESVTGVLPEVIRTISGLQAEIDLPDGFEDAGLAAGELQLEIISSLPYPGSFGFTLSGDRQQTLAISGEILPASGGVPIASQVNVADAASLLSPIPQVITAEGSVVYGDGVTAGTVTAGDFFIPSLRLTAPLRLYLDGIEHDGEVEGIGLAEDTDQLESRFGNATISAEFDNHLPFGVTAELFLSNRRSDLPGNAIVILGPTTVEPATTDAEGRAISPTTTQANFTVTDEQSHIFEGDSLFISERIQLFSPLDGAVWIQDEDFLTWRALLQVETEMGDREW